jgi:chromosome segregation ATPase
LERDRFNDTDADESALLEKSEVARTALTEIAENMVTLATRVEDVWQQWQIDRNSSAWRIALDVATRAYEALQERLESQGVGDSAEYGEYVQRRQSIEDRLRALEEKRVHLDQVKQDAEQSLERLRDLRRALTKRRSQFLNNILAENQFIKIEVTPYGSVENVESEFRHIIQRPNRFDRAIEGLLSRFNSHDTDGDSVEQKLQELKADVRNLVCENPNAPSLPYQAGFVDHLKGLRPECSTNQKTIWTITSSMTSSCANSGKTNSGVR